MMGSKISIALLKFFSLMCWYTVLVNCPSLIVMVDSCSDTFANSHVRSALHSQITKIMYIHTPT